MTYYFKLKKQPTWFAHDVGTATTKKVDLTSGYFVGIYSWEQCHDFRNFYHEQFKMEAGRTETKEEIEDRRIYRPASETEFNQHFNETLLKITQ